MIKVDTKELEGIIEGILFSFGEPISINNISEALDIDKKSLQSVIDNMIGNYSSKDRGIQIIQVEDSYQLCTKPEYYEYIKKIVPSRAHSNLSSAALETLAVIAYTQPVTRSNIEQIRGVNSGSALTKLIERELVEVKGRLDAPGKPMLYGTTDEFLRCFGLKSLNDLPDIDELIGSKEW